MTCPKAAADRAPAGVGIGFAPLADADQQDGPGGEGLVPGVRAQQELAALAFRAGRRDQAEEIDPLHVLHPGAGLGAIEDG